MVNKEHWTNIINSRSGWFDLKLSQLWSYRDLISLFVKRDFVSVYKQTVLGPFWHVLQPLLNSLVFSFAFSFIGRISTENMPPVLFYLSGIVPWSYFADCVNRTSTTFTVNAGLFGKVYFPRLAAPVAVAISSLVKFAIQLLLFLIIWFIFYFKLNNIINPNFHIAFIPFLLLIMSLFGLGIGLIVSSLTTRYRDLANLVGFGVQFLMYLSPVIFPASIWPPKVQWVIQLNPMTPVIETFRYSFLGIGSFNRAYLLYSLIFSTIVFLIGMVSFNKVEKNFIDTI